MAVRGRKKGTKNGNKIDMRQLESMCRRGKSRKEIAEHFQVSVSAVNMACSKYGLTKAKINAWKDKSRACLEKGRLFRKVNEEHINAQIMMATLGKFTQQNEQIWDFLTTHLEKLSTTDKTATLYKFRLVLKSMIELQDTQVERIKDKIKFDADALDINNIQKYLSAFAESYAMLPIEYRQKFNNELKKRDIAHLGLEQLVSSEPNRDRNGDIPEARTVETTVGDADTRKEDGGLLEGQKLLERSKSDSD